MPAMIRYLDHWATAAPEQCQTVVIRHPGVSSNDGNVPTGVPICLYVHKGIESHLQLSSDPPSLQAPEGSCRY
ncbi:hypothetical protein TNCV_4502821 [Trichonephila clavipes]|nr:hypothetical protein TNCV_4502821 [Trichonephila clavipes]